jgi:hypothetical protein
MLWVAAWRVVAGVADEQGARIFSVLEHKCETASSIHLLADTECAISALAALCAKPRPAFVFSMFFDAAPESFNLMWLQNWKWSTLAFGHVGSSFEPMCLTATSVQALVATHQFTKSAGDFQ